MTFIRTVEEPLYAIRRWSTIRPTRSDDPFLRSVTARFNWPSPVLKAHVNPHTHPLGIFAWNDLGIMNDPIMRGSFYPGWGPMVYGIIELLGNVCLHEFGFRAERAIIRSLVYEEKSLSRQEVLGLENRYQAPVTPLPEESFLIAYNCQLPTLYREGNFEETLENLPEWCSRFLWWTRDEEVMPLGQCTDTHIQAIGRILQRMKVNRSSHRNIDLNVSPRWRAFQRELNRRQIDPNVLDSPIASRFAPVKGEQNP